MAEKAVAAVIQDACVQSISTCSVDDLIKALGISDISESQISRSCEELNERARTFLKRPLESDWPYL